MITVKINNKVFNSISRAAKFLGINRPALSVMLKNKQATTYKDLLIEKLEVPSKTKDKTIHGGRRKATPIIVDGVAYNSCWEADKKFGFNIGTLSKKLNKGVKEYKGHKIEPVYPSMIKDIKPTNTVRVYCVDTDTTFDTLSEAARFAGADGWTMSKKMETSGYFIDNAGRAYKRLSPMKTKNVYKDTGSTLMYQRAFAKRTVKNKKPEVVDTPVVETPKPEVKQPVVLPNIVKEAINDKIIQLLKEKGIYDEIIELLNYGGFTSIKFDTTK
jgi:DNA-binding protein Fis